MMKTFSSILLLIVSAPFAFGQEQNEESPQRYLRYHHSVDPRTVEIKDDSNPPYVDRRSFLRYESSEWEKIWLDNVDKWASEEKICEELNTPPQMKYMHDFLKLTCSAYYQAPYDNWCIIDDEHRPLWYNTINTTTYDLHWVNPVPEDVGLAGPLKPVVPGPEHEHIVSKMIFHDWQSQTDYVEYIEPLVSHLRFPLCKCFKHHPYGDRRYHWHGIIFKGYIIPPPPTLKARKKYYFDAGASDWNHGDTGSSLKYFHQMWNRSGITFDEIYAFEGGTSSDDFYKTVPDDMKSRVHYQQCMVVSSPEEEKVETEPFIPSVIKRIATGADYVLFKLDIDQPDVEHGNIDFILKDGNNFVDEIAWEHHISGNYLMEEWGGNRFKNKFTLRESYELFLQLRQKGIRAHSWI